MPPALIVLVDESEIDDSHLGAMLDLGRRVGGVGRVLLFRPSDAESRLTARALGYRLWPQEGETSLARYANAFRQALELGSEGAVVIDRGALHLAPDVIGEAAALLSEHHGAVMSDGAGGIALLALQEPVDTLFAGDEIPSYDEILTRANQLRIRLVELPQAGSPTASPPSE